MDYVYGEAEGQLDVGYLSCGVTIYEDEESGVYVKSLAPADRAVKEYYESLRQALEACERGIAYSPPRMQHNNISAAIFIRFGNCAVILGGDVEAGSWDYSLRQLERSGPRDISSHVVKVSHHGSMDAFNEEFWNRVSKSTNPIAVFMPYSRFELPSKEAVEGIRRFADPLLSTWSESAAVSELWKELELAERLALEEGPFFEFYADPTDRIGRWSLSLDSEGRTLESASGGPATTI